MLWKLGLFFCSPFNTVTRTNISITWSNFGYSFFSPKVIPQPLLPDVWNFPTWISSNKSGFTQILIGQCYQKNTKGFIHAQSWEDPSPPYWSGRGWKDQDLVLHVVSIYYDGSGKGLFINYVSFFQTFPDPYPPPLCHLLAYPPYPVPRWRNFWMGNCHISERLFCKLHPFYSLLFFIWEQLYMKLVWLSLSNCHG